MEIIRNILLVPELFLFMYLGFSSFYFLIFSIAAKFYKEKEQVKSTKKYKVTVLIPAYKEDEVILETAISAMQHTSKFSELEILVIGDSLQEKTIELIRKTGATVLPVSFEKSTKTKSIQKSFEIIDSSCDYVIILDADNIMENDFVDKMILKLEEGFKVVQGHRTSKNENTNFAFLDGLSEEVNNAIFREGHRVLGFSASLIGSAFACQYKLFKELISQGEAVGGFDKELELMLLERKITIAYAKNAVVYDEKIQASDAFVNQRKLWLAAQFAFFGKNIKNGFLQLFKQGNFDYFDKLIQFLVPPRILALGISLIAAFINFVFMLFFYQNNFIYPFWAWFIVVFASSLAILLAIPKEKFSIKMLKSILTLLQGFALMLFALLKIKGANKKFIHTKHGIKK